MSPFERLVFNTMPIYILPDRPEWLVPNTAGDQLLSDGESEKNSNRPLMADLRQKQFMSLLPSADEQPYTGRNDYLALNRLEECWLHITDHCNLACRHCLFSCSAHTRTTLSLESITSVFDQCYRLGARIFYLTGGEPLMHPDINDICRLILTRRPDTRLVILTNGLLLPACKNLLKNLPQNRLYLQISIDGREQVHDAIRGQGVFRKLMASIAVLDALDSKNTLAMAVHKQNISQMTDIIYLASEYNISSVHYLWLMITGKADASAFVPPGQLFDGLVLAARAAEKSGITIDNLENMASQVFSTPGTKYDLGNAGWTSIAVGPDGEIYPTPALIGQSKTKCGHIDKGIETIWRNSDTLNALRRMSLIHSPAYAGNPLKFIVGGGDIDHSFYAGGQFINHDPYVPLYNQMALWLIHQAAQNRPAADGPRILLKMGDHLRQCHQDGRGVALTHSNCVLTLSDTRQVVGDFYTRAAEALNADIMNPVCYPETSVDHIPAASRIRSYGCGSPIIDAYPAAGETVVDLGAGAGLECFIAAREVGRNGRVIGIDMLDDMIERARQSAKAVAKNLGYSNVAFEKGFLEQIPLADHTADIIISNCVINLSEDKRRTFSEIMRVLKPGGRIVVSDVVTDTQMPPEISNDPKLRGECIAGAMRQTHLMAMLEDSGFGRIRIVKRFFYRKVGGHRFYALTYSAFKPEAAATRRIIYPGPHAAAVTDSGELLARGQIYEKEWRFPADNDTSLLVLDEEGSAANQSAETTCACYTAPENRSQPADGIKISPKISAESPGIISPPRHASDCMRCGKPLLYLDKDESKTCAYCGWTGPANAVCEAGHFVCDSCHSHEADEIVRQICQHTKETQMIKLLDTIRSHPAFPVHGPEHHFTVPAVIVATYRNRGGDVSNDDILAAIDRGRAVPGGVCAFWGACGAALGVGIGFGIILQSNPLKPGARQLVQQAVGEIINEIAAIKAARCCRRESYTALLKAAAWSKQILPISLDTGPVSECRQQENNRECIWQACPQSGADRQSQHTFANRVF